MTDRSRPPFPSTAIPGAAGCYIQNAAEAIGCAACMIALPLLSAIASAIGNARAIVLKNTWIEPAVVWSAIVADSGCLKSPAIDAGVLAVSKREEAAWNAAEREDGAVDLNPDVDDAGADDQSDESPPRCMCSDISLVAILDCLRGNRRGMLAVNQELSGWMSKFNGSSGAGPLSHWLEMHRAGRIVYERRHAPPIHIARAAVSVTGGIQPETLKRALGQQHLDNGLAPRFLLTLPPETPGYWTTADGTAELTAALIDTFDGLYALEPNGADATQMHPRLLRMDGAALRLWIEFHNEHVDYTRRTCGVLSAVCRKLRGYAPRLALLVHCLRVAEQDGSLKDPDTIDAESMERAITLTRWFRHEARRVYALLAGVTDELVARVEVIKRIGGRISVRDWMRRQHLGKAPEAEAELEALVRAGWGQWVYEPGSGNGGRPSKVFVLFDDVDP